jgi:hypothetical protein
MPTHYDPPATQKKDLPSASRAVRGPEFHLLKARRVGASCTHLFNSYGIDGCHWLRQCSSCQWLAESRLNWHTNPALLRFIYLCHTRPGGQKSLLKRAGRSATFNYATVHSLFDNSIR